MFWLLVTILSYFFLAIVVLFDRYFLVGSIPDPKIYTFYIGILWLLLSSLFIPFGISFPEGNIILLGLGIGLVRVFAILFLAKSIAESEVSRAIPAIGGLLPIFTFFLFFLYFPKGEILNFSQIIAFALLVFGSVLISLKKFSREFFTFETLKNSLLTAFLFALVFFLSKILFSKISFLDGFFLMLLGGGLGAISFLISSEVRKNIFVKKFGKKISGLFLLGQAFGGLGVLSQYYAVFLAEPGQVPLINALDGIRYVFLLFFVFLLSLWKPHLLKEEMKGTTLVQKIIAILLIGAGLAFLALK